MYRKSRRYQIEELTWPANFYEPISGEERYTLLEAAMKEVDSEENRLRYVLWQCRYGSTEKNHGKPKVDYFMKLWMDLEFASGRTSSVFGVKKVVKDIKKDLDQLGVTKMKEYGELGQELLYQEFVQGGRYYFELCASDKNYNTELMGLKQISDNHFLSKILSDVYRICYTTPTAFDLKEDLELFTKAVTNALEMDYPDLSEDLHKAIEANTTGKIKLD